MFRAQQNSDSSSTGAQRKTSAPRELGFRFKSKDGNQTKLDNIELEKHLQDVASILMNMIVISMEKRRLCRYYDASSGICKCIKVDIPIPTLFLVPENNGDGYRIAVSKHPEVCSVCPFWEKIERV